MLKQQSATTAMAEAPEEAEAPVLGNGEAPVDTPANGAHQKALRLLSSAV
jgi:hypothetical protein